MEHSGNVVASALLENHPLDLGNSSTVEHAVSELSQMTDHQFNSRCQLVYRIAHGPAEVAQSLPVHSPIKRFADVGAVQPELDVVPFVDHEVLWKRDPETNRRRKRKD